MEFKLLQNVQGFFNPPNTKISIITNARLTNEVCENIQKILQLKEDLTAMDIQTELIYSRYSKTVQINDPGQFKIRLLECEKTHPTIAFFADYMSFMQRIPRSIFPIISAVAAIIGLYVEFVLIA